MKRILFTILLSLLLAAPATAMAQVGTVALDEPVQCIVVKSHGELSLHIDKDSTSRIASTDAKGVDYTYTSADGGTLTINNGRVSLWIVMSRTLSLSAYGHASVTVMSKDTVYSDNINILARDYSNIDISCPLNSDTLTAFSFGHAVISIDDLEGYAIDLSDQEFSHINIDRRSLRIKHTPKKRRSIFRLFGF